MTGEQPPPPVDPAASAVLRSRFGENWRTWANFRKQWSKLSLSVVGGLLTGLGIVGAWALNLSTHVTILETRVMPVLQESKQESDNALQIANIDKRVTRIEDNLDLDLNEKLKAARSRK